LGRVNVPVSGGGYFRLKPWPVYRSLAGRCANNEHRPFMFYIHPWEVDPEQPDIGAGSRVSRVRHYLNLNKTAGKLKSLLREWEFATVSEAITSLRDLRERLGVA